jgi:predicted PurR-regulated permease PerM
MSAESNNPSGGGSFNLGNVLVYSAAFVIVIAGLQEAASILIPVLLAVFITIVLAPAYFALQKWVNPTLALGVLIFGLIVASFGMVALGGNAIDDFTAKKETYINNLTEHSKGITQLIERFTGGGKQSASEAAKDDSDAKKDSSIGSTVAKHEPDAAPDNPKTPSQKTASVTGPEVSLTGDQTVQPASKTAPAGAVESSEKKRLGLKEVKSEMTANFQTLVQENSAKIINYAGAAAGTVGALLGNTFLIVMIAIFLLLEAASLPKKIKGLPGMNDETWNRLTAAVVSVRHYTELKTSLSLLTGFLCWVMLAILKVEYAILFGLLAFILNYVPNIGSLIAAVPAVLIAWLGAPIESAITQATIVAVGYIVINTVVGNIIEPKILDRGLGLSASIIVVTMVFWGWVLGPVGMLLSVPLTMIAKIALEASNDTQWIGAMMGSDDAEAPAKKETT